MAVQLVNCVYLNCTLKEQARKWKKNCNKIERMHIVARSLKISVHTVLRIVLTELDLLIATELLWHCELNQSVSVSCVACSHTSVSRDCHATINFYEPTIKREFSANSDVPYKVNVTFLMRDSLFIKWLSMDGPDSLLIIKLNHDRNSSDVNACWRLI